MNAHRLDFETQRRGFSSQEQARSGFTRESFRAEKPHKLYIALVHEHRGAIPLPSMAKLAPHPVKLGLMRVDERRGKRAQTSFRVIERFTNNALVECSRSRGARIKSGFIFATRAGRLLGDQT